MSIFSAIFGSNKKPDQAQMNLLMQYAQLAEDIGIESLSYGADENRLPATKEELREIIALASLQPWYSKFVLKSDDLIKLYGALELFIPSEELSRVEKATALADELDSMSEDDIPADKRVIFEDGIRIWRKCRAEFKIRKQRIKAHAARIR